MWTVVCLHQYLYSDCLCDLHIYCELITEGPIGVWPALCGGDICFLFTLL